MLVMIPTKSDFIILDAKYHNEQVTMAKETANLRRALCSKLTMK